MPVYTERIKNKKTGQLVDKTVDNKKQYYIRTYITDEFGNRKQITRHNKEWLGKDGYWQAQQEESRLQQNINFHYNNMLFSEIAYNFLEYKKPMIKLSTYLKYNDDIKSHILPYFHNKIANKITTADILCWQSEINNKNLSLCVKKRLYSTFSSLLKHGCVFFGLQQNVIKLVDNFKGVNGAKRKEMNFLTEEEFNKFISFEKNDLYKSFFTILFYSGMRRGELLALTVNDVDFKDNAITINKTYSPRYKKYGIDETVPKTECSNRTIKMLSIVRVLLQSLTSECNTRLFENISLTTLKRKCDINCKKADINKNIRIHDFRHSFASMCIEKDVPISIISKYLGHENISITLDTYSHLYPNSQEKLLTKLEKQDQKQDQ